MSCKRLIAAISVLSIIYAGSFILEYVLNNLSPRMYVENQIIELGEYYEGDIIPIKLKIENRGLKSLQITRVNSACKCTEVDIKERNIKWKGYSEIKITFDSSNRDGIQTIPVYIASNDPDNSVYKVSVNCNIRPILNIYPRFINFREEYLENNYTIDISSTNKRPFKIKSARLGKEYFMISEIIELEPYFYKISIERNHNNRGFSDILSVETDLSTEFQSNINVEVVVLD